MGIASYIKEIGRGREGARALTREQAADLMGQVLDGRTGAGLTMVSLAISKQTVSKT